MPTKYAILQSGFLAFEDAHLAAGDTTSPAAIATSIKLNKPIKSTGNDNFYHVQIDTMADELSRNYRLLKDFEFRKRYLLAIMDAFKRPSVFDWFRLQQSSPFFTNLHRKFINETLGYISGQQRTIDIQSWAGLLEPKPMESRDKLIPDLIDKYFDIHSQPGTGMTVSPSSGPWNTLSDRVIPSKITDFIAQWTSQPEGFEDMFIATGVIFSRKRILDIGYYDDNQ